MNDLMWLGFKELLESEITGVDMLISELTKEYDELKTRLNLRAHDTYIQVIDGYRDMSSRKNYLESERNSIVIFINEIDKEKTDVFMDAFKKVDDDIRKTFAEIADGSAYLQIENEDIFSGGLALPCSISRKAAKRVDCSIRRRKDNGSNRLFVGPSVSKTLTLLPYG